MKSFNIDVEKTKHRVVLTPRGSVNSVGASALDAKLKDVISNNVTVVVDLGETTFINSSGIGALLGAAANLRTRGGELVLVNLPKIVEDLFDLLRVADHFHVVGSLEEIGAPSEP